MYSYRTETNKIGIHYKQVINRYLTNTFIYLFPVWLYALYTYNFYEYILLSKYKCIILINHQNCQHLRNM
jgi:hypothetical protein